MSPAFWVWTTPPRDSATNTQVWDPLIKSKAAWVKCYLYFSYVVLGKSLNNFRDKWLNCFNSVTQVLCFVSLFFYHYKVTLFISDNFFYRNYSFHDNRLDNVESTLKWQPEFIIYKFMMFSKNIEKPRNSNGKKQMSRVMDKI